MKILFILLLLISQLFSNEIAELYSDSKKVIRFMESGLELKSEVDIYRVSNLIGYYQGIIDYYLWYKGYNKYQELKKTGLYDKELDKKICLEEVTPIQLAKTMVLFLDKNPEFLDKDKFQVIWGMLSHYECKR
jgi:hypothetical protein